MNDRAASNLIGFLLIFSLVASVIAIVSVTGVDALNDVKRGEQVNNAERAFDVLADNMNDVHREGAPSRATEISLQDAQIDTSGFSTIEIHAWDPSGGDLEPNFTVNQTVNSTVWESKEGRETKIAYEFGAVVREQPDGGLIVRRPPIQWEEDRTIVPVVDTDAFRAGVSSGRTVRVRGIRQTPRIAYAGDGTIYTELWVNITSPRADIWAEYLESRPGTDCTLSDAPGERDRVRCELDQRDELYVAVYPVTVNVE
jgi:hypothetical protein